MLFSFGRKKRRTTKRNIKPPARLLKMCRKYRVKVTRKIGRRKVYKTISVLKKQLRKKMKLRKTKKSVRKNPKTPKPQNPLFV
jgi:hypothetical protein